MSSRASHVSGGGRVSRLASSCPKDFEFEFFVYQNEVNYNIWWSAKRLLLWVRGLADDTWWNCLICCFALVGLLQVAADIDLKYNWCMAIDILYNIVYAGHSMFMFFERVRQAMYENTDFTSCMKYGFLADVISYLHYLTVLLPRDYRRPVKLLCYYVRLHTPFQYLWALTDSNLKGSVLGTAFKYFYIFIVLRITCAIIWMKVKEVQDFFNLVERIVDDIEKRTPGIDIPTPKAPLRNIIQNNSLSAFQSVLYTLPSTAMDFNNATVVAIGDMVVKTTALATTSSVDTFTFATDLFAATIASPAFSRVKLVQEKEAPKRPRTPRRMLRKPPKLINYTVNDNTRTGRFIRAVYIINMMFMPIGPTVNPATDYERVTCLMIMIIGSLVVTGAAVASLALVISLYMRPEEVFRARFRLIMDEMASTHVSQEMREKVETFYRMYWHKQKAVSVTQLLPTFPPTLPSAIFTDIYFEAQQRSQILRDLSYQFLWELAKNMVTIHYIPGDAIIKRKAEKASIIYISYGDIEMLTAEDDDTPILRMTRGTMISPCGGCAPMACGQALVEIRAATYCTAHVLTAANLWRVALKHGKTNGQAFIIVSSFEEHFERVKRHYRGRVTQNVKYKSSILQFKRNLMALKEAKDDNGNLLMTRSDYFLEIAGTYIMRNRADATLADEADEICLRPTFPCILQPNSSLLIFWHVLMAMLILTVIFTHPYHIVFLEHIPVEFKFFDVIVSFFFVLDMVVHLSTGANVEEGVAITFTQTCTQQIQSYWFILDVVATLPIFEFVGDGHWAGINKLLRTPKVFRVLKNLEDMSVYHSYILRFLSYTLFMIIASYVFAAIHQAYMCFNFNSCSVTNYTHTPFWSKGVMQDDMIWRRLSYGLYYAVSLLTCTSYKTAEWELFHWHNLVYVSVALEVATIIIIMMEAMYSATIMVTSAFREDYISTINDVKTFLVRNNVDSMLRKRFITYLSLCWHTDKAYSMTHKKSIFFDLPPHVYQDIVAKQRIKYILSVPFMKYLRSEDLKHVSAKTRLFYTSPNEILQNTGDIGNEIFIIKQGICQLYDPDTKQPIRRITVRDSFGILECLLRFPAFYTVVAVTHVQLLAVPNKYLQNALRVPRLRDAIDFAKEQDEYGRSQMRREPFLNYEPPPPTTSLYRFPLLRKFEPDTAFMQPFTRLGFLSILRYVFPRFTIRPDGNYIYRYEWFRAICALTGSFLFPSYTYMVLQVPELVYIIWILDLLAYFDIIQRMLVGYYNDDGILVSHPASTAAHYIKGAFLVDAFGSLPLERLESDVALSTDKGHTHILVNPIVQVLMLNRLIQLYRLPGAMDILSNFIEREDILLIIKALPIFMVVINILTCAMLFSSVQIFTEMSKQSWSINPVPDRGGSWLHIFNNAYRFNLTETPLNLQLTIYSWVVYEVTTTGYNIFQPSNFYLIWILYLGMLLGGMMTTYFAVRVISIRANVNKMLASFQEHMKDIEQYMNKEKLKPKLQKDVIAYYEYNWEKTGGTDYRNVLKLCDQITLRTDAILHLYGHTFARCPILYHCDLSLLRVVGRAVRSQYFLSDTTIISKGDLITDMYFVDYGTVDVRESKEIIRTEARLPRGSVFGNLEHAAAICSPTDLVATAHCHLLQINTLMFYDIILDFPTVKVLIKKYRPKHENYIIGGLGEGTGLMNQWKEHRTPSSPMIVVSRKGVSNYFNINSRTCQIYLILVSLGVMYLDIYNAGFQSNTMLLIMFLYIFDVAFIFKIPLSYIQPYVVLKGEQRIALLENRKTYFKSEFYYDLASCIPIEVLCLLASGGTVWTVFSILRLNRLFRVVTIRSCLKRHQSKLNINLVLSTIVAVSIWFSLFVHSTACLWYSVGALHDMRPGRENSSWMYSDDKILHCGNQYVCSLYMILTTFAHKGVGDIMPKNQWEVIFMTILEIVSTLMFMIYVGEFSNIIQYQSFRSFGYYCKFLELQDFLSNNRVSKNLVNLVTRYTLHLWRESRGVQIPFFLETAPPCFKLKVMSAAYMQHLIMHPSFKDCEPAFLRQLVGCLTLFRYNTDLFVVKEGEITDSMYLIHNGRVVEVDEDMDDETNEFTPGSHFGQIQGLMRDTPFNYSYKTTSKAEVLTLSLDNWEHLLEHFPKSRYSIFKNYPNHPYSRHPDDIPLAQKKKSIDDKKRQMMARRKTEHELKSTIPSTSSAAPLALGERDMSPRESANYRPFYTPPTLSLSSEPTETEPQEKFSFPSKITSAEPPGTAPTEPIGIASGIPPVALSGMASALPSDETRATPSETASAVPSEKPPRFPSGRASAALAGKTPVPASGTSSAVPSGKTPGVPSGTPSAVQSGKTPGVPSGTPSTVQSGKTPGVPSGTSSTVQSGKTPGVPSGTPSSVPSEKTPRIPSGRASVALTGKTPAAPSATPSAIPSGKPPVAPSGVASTVSSEKTPGVPSERASVALAGKTPATPSAVPSGKAPGVPSGTPSTVQSGKTPGVPSGTLSTVPSEKTPRIPSGRASEALTGKTPAATSATPSAIPSGKPLVAPSGVASTVSSEKTPGVPSGKASVALAEKTPATPSAVRSGKTPGVPSGTASDLQSGKPSAIPSGTVSALPSGKPPAAPSATAPAEPSAKTPGVPFGTASAVPSERMPTMPSGTASAVPAGKTPSVPPKTVPVMPSETVSGTPSWKAPTVPSGTAPTVSSGTTSAIPALAAGAAGIAGVAGVAALTASLAAPSDVGETGIAPKALSASPTELSELRAALTSNLEPQRSAAANATESGQIAPRPTSVMGKLSHEPLEEEIGIAPKALSASPTELSELRAALTSNLEPQRSAAANATESGQIAPRPTSVMGKLSHELLEETNIDAAADPDKIQKIYARRESHFHRDTSPTYSKASSAGSVNKAPSDDNYELLPGRGITATEIFDELTDGNEQAPSVPGQTSDSTKKATVTSDEDSVTRLIQQISDTTYVDDILPPTASDAESKSVAMRPLSEDEQEAQTSTESPEIEVEPPVTTSVTSKTPVETSDWPLNNRAEKEVIDPIKKALPTPLQPALSLPKKHTESLPRIESGLYQEPSMPYFNFDTEEETASQHEPEEYEEEPKSLIRRMTQHAKRFVGRQSISQGGEIDDDKKDASTLEQDIKATSALLAKYEEKTKKHRDQGEGEEKSLLDKYIEKRDAELAASHKDEAKEEEPEEEFYRAPRRSIVVFGGDEAPPVRTIPIEQPDDDEEVAAISRAPRRSVVVFDSEGKPPTRVLPPQDTDDAEDEPETKRIPAIAIQEESSENKVFEKPNRISSSEVPELVTDAEKDSKHTINQTELPVTTTGETKSRVRDSEPMLDIPKFYEDTIDAEKIKMEDDGETNATTSTSTSEQPSAPGPSNLKKPEKRSFLGSLFNKKKSEEKNKPEDAELKTTKDNYDSGINDENEDYESKLNDDDEWRADKRLTRVRYVGDKNDADEFEMLDLEEGPSTSEGPQRRSKPTLELTDEERKSLLMDSDEDPMLRHTDKEDENMAKKQK